MSKIEQIKELLYLMKEKIGDDLKKLPFMPPNLDEIKNEDIIKLYSMVSITFNDDIKTYENKIKSLITFYEIEIDPDLIAKYINHLVYLIFKIKKI
jgi:hypothetical protein